MDATWKKLRVKFSIIGIGSLPREDGPFPIAWDALHAKLYAVGVQNPAINNTRLQTLPNRRRALEMIPIECFFGSANFTNGGLGQEANLNMKYDPNKKWEIVGRALDQTGMQAILTAFSSLWYKSEIFFVNKENRFSWRKKISRKNLMLKQESFSSEPRKTSIIVLIAITMVFTSAATVFITKSMIENSRSKATTAFTKIESRKTKEDTVPKQTFRKSSQAIKNSENIR